MTKYIDIITNAYTGYANYLLGEIINPSWHNYFYWLILVSVFFLILEVVIPWRRDQLKLRKDFWLDGFYMFFNFFIFSLIIHKAASDVVVNLFNDGIMALTGGFNLQAVNPMRDFPMYAILLIGFLVRDFVQWWIHRLLHKSERLWEFHKVHHSVEEMGFAAHLRFHWMESIIYKVLEYIPLALLGIGLYDFFVIHIFTLTWGHYNHSNIRISGKITGGILGALFGILTAHGLLEIPVLIEMIWWQKIGWVLFFSFLGSALLAKIMKYIFNSPEMHIWHHSYNLPADRHTGVNFGLTLAIWDYLFGTAYIPHTGKDIKLGFPGIEEFPDDFGGQVLHGFNGKGSTELINK